MTRVPPDRAPAVPSRSGGAPVDHHGRLSRHGAPDRCVRSREPRLFPALRGRHDFHLQRCTACDLLRYPPTTGLPLVQPSRRGLDAGRGRGTVHSYAEVHHPIQPAFKDHLPYLILIVELDTPARPPRRRTTRCASPATSRRPRATSPRPSWSPRPASAPASAWSSRTSPPASRSRSGPWTRRRRPLLRFGGIPDLP